MMGIKILVGHRGCFVNKKHDAAWSHPTKANCLRNALKRHYIYVVFCQFIYMLWATYINALLCAISHYMSHLLYEVYGHKVFLNPFYNKF